MRSVPWLAPLWVPQREFDALLFRTCLAMGVGLVGGALRHWENCYVNTANWLDVFADLDEDAATLSMVLLREREEREDDEVDEMYVGVGGPGRVW